MIFPSRVAVRLMNFVLCAFVLPAVAQADCSAALDALAKSWQQARLAQYDVTSPEEALPSKPAMVRIGKTIWTDTGGAGRSYRSDDAPAENPLAFSIKRQAAKGPVNCEPAGNGTYRGQPVVKYKLDPSAGSNTTGRITLWVSKTSGLPVYQEYEKTYLGGYAWVYGDTVKEPSGK